MLRGLGSPGERGFLPHFQGQGPSEGLGHVVVAGQHHELDQCGHRWGVHICDGFTGDLGLGEITLDGDPGFLQFLDKCLGRGQGWVGRTGRHIRIDATTVDEQRVDRGGAALGDVVRFPSRTGFRSGEQRVVVAERDRGDFLLREGPRGAFGEFLQRCPPRIDLGVGVRGQHRITRPAQHDPVGLGLEIHLGTQDVVRAKDGQRRNGRHDLGGRRGNGRALRVPVEERFTGHAVDHETGEPLLEPGFRHGIIEGVRDPFRIGRGRDRGFHRSRTLGVRDGVGC